MPSFYIGLMSGTSLDGVDAVLVEITDNTITHLHAINFPIPDSLRKEILAAIASHQTIDIRQIGTLDARLGELFASAVLDLVSQTQSKTTSISAIGSHGQTLWHAPSGHYPFSLQLGDPNRIAERTGITTIADFRRRDIAAGGQGAPLVPAFHNAHFRTSDETRVILNIGGMANITILPGDIKIAPSGFDTGPGNIFLDLNARLHLKQNCDNKGAWASTGHVNEGLLKEMLDDPYFHFPPPKSTGRERFNKEWLSSHLAKYPGLLSEDIQATLTELTVRSITDAIHVYCPDIERLIVCGGGSHNEHLMKRLASILTSISVESTAKWGLDPDWVEATAFAWFAKRTLHGLSSNLPSVTGARHAVVLGAIYPSGKPKRSSTE
ncbi:anhydro-N-acetylmuramic acid kinase [Acidihalobacter prosperus]